MIYDSGIPNVFYYPEPRSVKLDNALICVCHICKAFVMEVPIWYLHIGETSYAYVATNDYAGLHRDYKNGREVYSHICMDCAKTEEEALEIFKAKESLEHL